jgi:hypothetical protein
VSVKRTASSRGESKRARAGTTRPEPVPHPDDVIIDYETGKVRFDGPIDEEQKTAGPASFGSGILMAK